MLLAPDYRRRHCPLDPHTPSASTRPQPQRDGVVNVGVGVPFSASIWWRRSYKISLFSHRRFFCLSFLSAFSSSFFFLVAFLFIQTHTYYDAAVDFHSFCSASFRSLYNWKTFSPILQRCFFCIEVPRSTFVYTFHAFGNIRWRGLVEARGWRGCEHYILFYECRISPQEW